MNKQIVHDALILTAFTLVIGVILGAVYGITKTPIDKANEQTKKEAYQAVFKVQMHLMKKSMMQMRLTN